MTTEIPWIEHDEKVNGPFYYEAKLVGWTMLVNIPNGCDMWHIQVWNRFTPSALSVDSYQAEWPGFDTADEAMSMAVKALWMLERGHAI